MYLSEKDFKHLCKKLNLTPPKKKKTQSSVSKNPTFDSLAEENFYKLYIQKKIDEGRILSCELHNEFLLLNSLPEYKLRKKVFKPDFLIKTQKNEIIIVEMKGKIVKKLQRDYGLRKHLFIEKYCIPNGWKYIELQSESWTQSPILSAQQNILDL